MRVVAGSARGLRLDAPAGTGTRPTGDRVRESVCNALASIDAIRGARVLDAYAGSGALAVEALSRGAESAVLVDRDRAARAAIEANLDRTGFTSAATVVAADALDHLARSTDRFDLVFLDPPYDYDRWPELLAAVVARSAPGAVVVVEGRAPVPVPAPLSVIREKRYGGTVVTFSQMPPSTAPRAGDQE